MEWTHDYYIDDLGSNSVIDPLISTGIYHTLKSTHWSQNATSQYVRLAQRSTEM